MPKLWICARGSKKIIFIVSHVTISGYEYRTKLCRGIVKGLTESHIDMIDTILAMYVEQCIHNICIAEIEP